MTTEEKLKYFEESALEEARKEAASMIEDYKTNLAKVEEEHKDTTLRQAELQLKTESDNLRRSNNMTLSKEQLQIKRKITQRQKELKEKLFVEVKQQLETFMSSPAYEQLLIKQIKAIQSEAGNGQLILYIDPADSDKRLALQAATGAPITISEYSFFGGTRAILQDRNILIDNSFSSKLETLKADFTFNGGASNA